MTSLSPTRGAVRLLRGGTAGLATGVLAVAAHTSAGRALPDFGVVLLPVLLVTAFATVLARRERGPLHILALIGSGQLAVHVLLGVLNRHSHSTSDTDPQAMTVAHVLATLLVVAVLAGAERAVFALTTALAAVLPRRLCPQPVVVPLRLPPTAPPPHPVAQVLHSRVLTRRGPPRSARPSH